MRVLAIDPGSMRSGWVVYDGERPESFGKDTNEAVRQMVQDLKDMPPIFEAVVIEWTAPRGMPASSQLFETMWWAGRFCEAAFPVRVERIERAVVKREITGSSAAKDSNVRQALIDRWGGVGGKEVAIGRKATPGPLYGITADCWQALAVAVAYTEGARLFLAE